LEFFESHSQLLLLSLTFISGVWLGMADKWRGQALVQDSVLRYCYRAGDWRPELMRSTFCSIVNGKKPLLNVDGSDLPEWKAKLHRILMFAMFPLLLMIVVPPLSVGANAGREQWAWLSPAAPAFFLAYYRVRLAGTTHRTKLEIRSANTGNRSKRIIIAAERDEDGVPSRDVHVDGVKSPASKET
jgi:hypothetical protein